MAWERLLLTFTLRKWLHSRLEKLPERADICKAAEMPWQHPALKSAMPQNQGCSCRWPLEQGLHRGGCEPWGGSQWFFCCPGHHPLLLRELLGEQRAGTGCFPSPGNALLCSGRSLANKITATVTLLIALALPGLVRFSPAHYLIQCKRAISGTCQSTLKTSPGAPWVHSKGTVTSLRVTQAESRWAPGKDKEAQSTNSSMAVHLSLLQERVRSEE